MATHLNKQQTDGIDMGFLCARTVQISINLHVASVFVIKDLTLTFPGANSSTCFDNTDF